MIATIDTRKVPPFVFMMLCPLLAFATSASAERAWVLWVNEERVSEPQTQGRWGAMEREWSVLEASSDEIGCRRQLQATIERVTDPGDVTPSTDERYYKVTGDTVMIWFIPKGAKPTDVTTHAQVLHYTCLPDTVDPRGPKGK